MTDRERIPVAEPLLDGREREYVLDCLDSGWISSTGKYVGRFEAAVADMAGVSGAVACTNGTAGLHLALLASGVGPGDEVLVPALAYVAVANAVLYCGATPVFVDSEPETGNLDPDALQALVTERTRAIIAVHLYGHPCEMHAVRAVADLHGLVVIEDAAEAHGARYHGALVGSLGDLSVFSFYGNKLVTTGEGGAVASDDSELLERVRILHGQGQDPQRRYWFPIVGFNYRMTNIAAAIGVAQLERLESHVDRRLKIAAWYEQELRELAGVRVPAAPPGARSVYWMNSVVLQGVDEATRDAVIVWLDRAGIETRPFFPPLHTLPIHARPGPSLPVAERLGATGISLPSGGSLSRSDVSRVVGALGRAIAKALCA
jgi:perosamine synthetase